MKWKLRTMGTRLPKPWGLHNLRPSDTDPEIAVALLTGGGDKHYALGLATELISKGAALDIVGSDNLRSPGFLGRPEVNFLDLRGDQRTDASLARKVFRVSSYYVKLIRYAVRAKPRIFHILWNNKFEVFDRTVLTLYYKILGKRIVLTAHNVNAGRRDFRDTILNRITLRVQYWLADHVFVHTEQMKGELLREFGIEAARVSIIPYGINNAVPDSGLTPVEARQRLRIGYADRTILFFGYIAPYKGLEYLIAAFQQMLLRRGDYRLIIAGRPKNCEAYWSRVLGTLQKELPRGRIHLKTEFIPDDEIEVYFKAADVLVLPYRRIYQSGVLFLGYSFGLPVLTADIGSLSEDVVEGRTGFVFRAEDPVDLVRAIDSYFASDLYRDLRMRRPEIREYAAKRHSWDTVGRLTMTLYAELLGKGAARARDTAR
jgi:D-inositol-3-phosphate glycosyltransferase